MGERERAFSTRRSPRSIRLAIATSPLRVSAVLNASVAASWMFRAACSYAKIAAQRPRSRARARAAGLSPFISAALQRLNGLRAEAGEGIFDVVRRMGVSRSGVKHLIVGQVRPCLLDINEV